MVAESFVRQTVYLTKMLVLILKLQILLFSNLYRYMYNEILHKLYSYIRNMPWQFIAKAKTRSVNFTRVSIVS